METQALCIYDTNTTRYDNGGFWRQLKHWNRKDVSSFRINDGRYFRLLGKGEAVGVVGSTQAGKTIRKKASDTKKEKHGNVKVEGNWRGDSGRQVP